MHYSTLTMLPILALVALTSAAPIAIRRDFSIPPPIQISDTNAAGAPILPKLRFARRATAPIVAERSAEDDVDEAWMGDFAQEKRSAENGWDEYWDGFKHGKFGIL